MPMIDPFIKTSSFTRRPWTKADASSLVRHADNPKIAARLRDAFPNPYTRADAERFIAMAAGGDTEIVFLAIEIDGEAAGGIGAHRLEGEKRCSAELGYWLAEPYWDRGIATDAVRGFVPVAFSRLGIIRLHAGIFSNNPASMRVLEKCGFVREDVHRSAIVKGGEVLDEVVYAMVKVGRDWE